MIKSKCMLLVKSHIVCLSLLLFIWLTTGCRTEQAGISTPTTKLSTTAVIASQSLSTDTPSPTFIETAVDTNIPQPTGTSSPTWTPWPTQTDVPIYTPSPKPTVTKSPTPFPTATIVPLPQGLPTTTALAGIGTAMPLAANIITADNVSTLTEVARWGKGDIHDAAYSPDGGLLYALTSQGLYVYDAATAKQLDFRPYANSPRDMALSSDGQIVAVVSQNNYIELRDVVSNTFITAFSPFTDPTIYIRQLEFDQSGEFLFLSLSGELLVWGIEQAISAAKLTDVDRLDFSPEAAKVVTATEEENVIKVWQWQEGMFTLITELDIPESIDTDVFFYNLEISPNGDYLALSDLYKSVAMWQIPDNQLLYILNERKIQNQGKRLTAPPAFSGPGRTLFSDMQFSPDSQLLATATGYQDVTLWRVVDGQSVLEIEKVGNRLAFKPDNSVVGAWTHTLSQWSVENGRYLNVLNQHIGPINDLALIPGKGQLAIASADSFVYLRLLHSGDLVTSLRTSENGNNPYFSPSAYAIDVTANGNTLVSASNDAYRVWDLDDYSMINLEPRPGWSASNMLISADGQYILGQEEESGYPLHMWQTTNDYEYMEASITASIMDFSPTDLILAAIHATFDTYDFVLWQPNTDTYQDLFLDLDSEELFIGAITFSPDGRYLAAVAFQNNHKKVLIWSINNNLEAELVQAIEDIGPLALRDAIIDIAISPNNHLLALKSYWDVRIFDVENGRLLYTLPMSDHGEEVLFSADGRYLITGHSDGSVRFWVVP